VLLFCIVIIHDVEYRVLEVKQYFFHLFILLVLNVEIFQAVHVSTFSGYLYDLHCVLYFSVGVSLV
jgi:hypothetical protein